MKWAKGQRGQLSQSTMLLQLGSDPESQGNNRDQLHTEPVVGHTSKDLALQHRHKHR